MARPTPPSRLMESVWVASPPDALTLAVSFRAHVLFGSLHVLTYHETSWRNPRLNTKCDNKQDNNITNPINLTKRNQTLLHFLASQSYSFLILSNSLSIGIRIFLPYSVSVIGLGLFGLGFFPSHSSTFSSHFNLLTSFLSFLPLVTDLYLYCFYVILYSLHPPSILSLSPSYALLASHSRPPFLTYFLEPFKRTVD